MNWRALSTGRRARRVLAAMLLLAVVGVALIPAGRHVWGREQFRQAKQALARNQLESANRKLAACLSLWPRDPDTLVLAARASRQGGHLAEADQYLRTYRQHGGDPTNDEFVIESTLLRAQQGEVDAVLRQCQKWVDERHPAATRVLEALVQSYIHLYRIPEAEVTVNIWLDSYPDDPQAYYCSGWVKEHRDAPERAAEDYKRSLRIDPDRDDVRLRLASALLASAQPAPALEQLDPLCRDHPDHLPTRVFRARALHGIGRTRDAETALDELLAEYPFYPPAMTERARLALLKGETAEAEKLLEGAVARSPGDSQGWYLLSQSRGRLGKAKEAEAAMKKFDVLQESQKRVRDIANRELSRRPNDPRLHCEVGAALIRGGEPREGLKWLKRALEKDPTLQEAHKQLADYYEKIGQIGLASRHREQAGGMPTEGAK